jgi:uncharacterized membrane protein
MTSEGPERPAGSAPSERPARDGAVEGSDGAEVAGEIARGAAERLAFFSDAVVAIAITLLAIELPVPEGNSDTELLHSLAAESLSYVTFLISFVVIASHWSAHHRVFRWVARADRGLVLLNLAWLLLVVLTPWLTEVLREGDELTWARFGIYATAQALLLSLLALMIARMSAKGLFLAGTPASLRRRGWAGAAINGIGFLVSIPLFPLLGLWTFAVWIVVPAALTTLAHRVGLVPRREREQR